MPGGELPLGHCIFHRVWWRPVGCYLVRDSRVGGDFHLIYRAKDGREGARLFRCSYRNRLLQFNLNFWQRVTEGTWELGRHSKQAQRVMYPIRGFILKPLPSLNIRASITSITNIHIILREVLVVRLLGGESVDWEQDCGMGCLDMEGLRGREVF